MTDWLEPNPFGLFGHDYFVEEVDGPYYEYFKSCDEAYQWALRHRPANVFRIPKGSEFYGEKGKTKSTSGRDVGNATLMTVVS